MGTTPIYAIPYTDPGSAVATYPATDKAAAEAVEAALSTYPTPRAARYKTAAQTLATANQFYVVTFEADDTQPSVGFTYSNGVFTPARAGLYLLSTSLHFATAGTMSVRWYCNGASLSQTTVVTTGTGSGVPSTRPWRLAAGDSVTVQASSSVAAGSVYGSGIRYTSVDIALMAP